MLLNDEVIDTTGSGIQIDPALPDTKARARRSRLGAGLVKRCHSDGLSEPRSAPEFDCDPTRVVEEIFQVAGKGVCRRRRHRGEVVFLLQNLQGFQASFLPPYSAGATIGWRIVRIAMIVAGAEKPLAPAAAWQN